MSAEGESKLDVLLFPLWESVVKPGRGSVLGMSGIGSIQAFCLVQGYLCGIAWHVWEDGSGFLAVL